MKISDEFETILRVLSRIYLWCFAFGMATLVFWFVVVQVAGDFAFGFHSKIFSITEHEFDLMNYYGMAIVKLVSFFFFFFPWAAIQLTLRGLKKGQ